MQRQKKLTAIRRALGDEAFTKGDEVIFSCPRKDCASRTKGKTKLSVNLKTDHFHCWSCNWGFNNLIPILRLSGDKQTLQEYLEEIGQTKPEVPQEKVYDTPILPSEFRTLSEPSRSPYYTQAIGYLASRGLTPGDILQWKLGYCEDGKYRNRIIVPSFDENGELNFFVGRLFSSLNSRKTYMHENFSKDIVWNDCMVDWDRSIVVTEGPFDAFKVGDNVVALQGSILRERSKLFNRIVMSGIDVYFAMDTDAFKKQLGIIEKLSSYGVLVKYVGLNGKKDVGVMSKEEFLQCKERAIPIRSSLDLLKLRTMEI